MDSKTVKLNCLTYGGVVKSAYFQKKWSIPFKLVKRKIPVSFNLQIL